MEEKFIKKTNFELYDYLQFENNLFITNRGIPLDPIVLNHLKFDNYTYQVMEYLFDTIQIISILIKEEKHSKFCVYEYQHKIRICSYKNYIVEIEHYEKNINWNDIYSKVTNIVLSNQSG